MNFARVPAESCGAAVPTRFCPHLCHEGVARMTCPKRALELGRLPFCRVPRFRVQRVPRLQSQEIQQAAEAQFEELGSIHLKLQLSEPFHLLARQLEHCVVDQRASRETFLARLPIRSTEASRCCTRGSKPPLSSSRAAKSEARPPQQSS